MPRSHCGLAEVVQNESGRLQPRSRQTAAKGFLSSCRDLAIWERAQLDSPDQENGRATWQCGAGRLQYVEQGLACDRRSAEKIQKHCTPKLAKEGVGLPSGRLLRTNCCRRGVCGKSKKCPQLRRRQEGRAEPGRGREQGAAPEAPEAVSKRH